MRKDSIRSEDAACTAPILLNLKVEDFTMSATLHCIIIDCLNPSSLSSFYERLLGWKPFPNSWFGLISPQGVKLEFQAVDNYCPPTWPSRIGQPGQMIHLDFYVAHSEHSVSLAQELSAVIAPDQFYTEYQCTTLFDPEGHPFCLLQAAEA